MKPIEISIDLARNLAIHAQGLHSHPSFGSGKSAVLRAIQHLGYIQIDTISVVERAHHHVLWSRVPDFKPTDLQTLQAVDRSVFEYWSHAASYLPIQDYRYSLPRMEAYARKERHWFRRNRKLMNHVLERIRAEGPLQARDFEAPSGRKSGPWFDWKPTKRALEQLFMEGRLMVRERRGFQKVYDLRERVLPHGTDVRMPTPEEVARHLAERNLRAHGLASEPQIRYLRRGMQRSISHALKGLREEGRAIPVHIRSLGDEVYFVTPELLNAADTLKPRLIRCGFFHPLIRS